MNWHLWLTKIVTESSPEIWSQAYAFPPHQLKKRKEHGDLFLVIKLAGSHPDLAGLGEKLVTSFHRAYYQSPGDGVLKRLKQALEAVETPLSISLLAGVVWENVLYLGILNQGQVNLLRGQDLATILRGEKGVKTASGFLKLGDAFVLGTEEFFQAVSPSRLQAALEADSPDQASEILEAGLAKEENLGVAAVIGKIAAPQKVDLSAIKMRAEKIFQRLKALFTPQKPSFYLSQRKKAEEKRQKMMMTVALVLIFLLIISIGFGLAKKRRGERARRFAQIWDQIEYQYEQGKDLAAINPRLAQSLLTDSLELAKAGQEKYSPRQPENKKLQEIEKEIEKALEEVRREYKLAEVPLFLDLSLVKEDLKAIDADLFGDKMVVLGERGTVVSLKMNRKAKILGKIPDGQEVTLWEERVFVLGEELAAVGEEIKIEKDWSSVKDLKSFGGHLYLLEEGGIFKYPLTATGFGARRQWLAEGEDLKEPLSLAIDGAIWVLQADGQVLKFSRGARQSFRLSGLEKELNEPTVLYTNPDCENLYLLDKGNRRLVVFNKEGEYKSQYTWKEMGKMENLLVNEREKKIFLFSGRQIYEIETK